MKRPAQLVALLVLTSCGATTTEIVLSVDTDIPSATAFRVDATYPRGRMESAAADLATRPAPRTLVLLHDDGPLGPVRLRIAADGPSGELLSVERVVAFEPGVSLALRVFLAQACRGAMCPADQTCGDDGSCRAIGVASCEYEGRTCGVDGGADAGPVDAGPPDDGGRDAGTDAASGDAGTECSSLMVCGIADTHLPGDLVTPRICSTPATPAVGRITGPSGEVAGSGTPASYLLAERGDYTVDLQDPSMGCFHSRGFRVAGPTVIDGGGAVTDTLRDIGARPGAAFVVGRRGAWAVDDAGWHDLVTGASGTVAPIDLRAVVVIGDVPFLGPNVDDGAVYRVQAVSPFGAVTHARLALPAGNRRVGAMGARVGGRAPLAIATPDDIIVVDDPTGLATTRTLDPSYDAQDWIAIGEVELANLGAVWGGRTTELVNRSQSGGGMLATGSTVPTAAVLDDVLGAAVDDRGDTSPSLWLCGLAASALHELPGGRDWPGTSTLPAPSALWTGVCNDIAIDVDGDVWLAGATAGLARLAPDGSERLVYGSPQGLPPATSVDFVAVAADGSTREVWILDASRRHVLHYRADLLP